MESYSQVLQNPTAQGCNPIWMGKCFQSPDNETCHLSCQVNPFSLSPPPDVSSADISIKEGKKKLGEFAHLM